MWHFPEIQKNNNMINSKDLLWFNKLSDWDKSQTGIQVHAFSHRYHNKWKTIEIL